MTAAVRSVASSLCVANQALGERQCGPGGSLPFRAFTSKVACQGARRHRSLAVRAAGFDLLKLLGGRGLVKEDMLQSEEGLAKLFKDEAKPKVKEEKPRLDDVKAEDLGAFGKELLGLTGGFPGGEKGVQTFVEKHPPPSKATGLVPRGPGARPRPVAPPLLMPGMTVRVTTPGDAYYMYTGIVQRVTDGKVGVLFEGGNWDKLVTFDLEDLERTKKGPPMSNPKSAVLEIEAS